MVSKEERIRKITAIYYSNPNIQKALLEFAKEREVVPRYFEGFGKRPDVLVYPSDIFGLVKKGATSFHASEEIWHNALEIDSNLSQDEINKLRKDWDLVIDIDSEYLDLSKVLALLVIDALEKHGVKNYRIKFSGNKGFHIIVSGKAFPERYEDKKRNEMFPEWPRAICEYLMNYIKRDYNKEASKLMDVEVLKKRKKLEDEDILESNCLICNNPVKKGELVFFKCDVCGMEIQRKNIKLTKRKLSCVQNKCAGNLEIVKKEEYFECENCKGVSSIDKKAVSGKYKATFTKDALEKEEFSEEVSGSKFGSSDLVLVAPRHLFRMPYSLHEKTSLASVVISKEEIEKFNPAKDASPLNVKIKNFFPENKKEEGMLLLSKALAWKLEKKGKEEKTQTERYKEYDEIELKGVNEKIFPKPIKKLLQGLEDGKKRGLFILLTFLRYLGFSAEQINEKIREWNKKNRPELRESYVRGQIDWHLKQKRKILPPNYSNEAYYKDLGLLDEMPKAKNPIVEVLRELKKK